MKQIKLNRLTELLQQAPQLLSGHVYSQPSEQDADVSYLRNGSQLHSLGFLDTPEFQHSLTRCGFSGIHEQKKRPAGPFQYHRILRKDGKVLRVDTYQLGKLTSTKLFQYRDNTRYCFTYFAGSTSCREILEAVVYDGERIAEEYRIEHGNISWRSYSPEENGSIHSQYLQYHSSRFPSLRLHSQGEYMTKHAVRYRETFLWMYSDGKDPGVNKLGFHRAVNVIAKLFITLAALSLFGIPIVVVSLLFSDASLWGFVRVTGQCLFPGLVAVMVFSRNRARTMRYASVFLGIFAVILAINMGIAAYDKSITINTAPNIDVFEYMPFAEDTKIVKLGHKASIELSGELPVLDGAAAVFPVYSSFVNALYPESTEYRDGVFEYNNTVAGYRALARKETDIFFGAYPSQKQIDYAIEQGTRFVYTPIGQDAFVFFVHKDNPIDDLTSEQLRGIYSGRITNWAQVGGKDEPIAAYQRNEGSGSQSMLIRFMGDTPIMEPETELVNDLMSGIIEEVAAYRSKSGSIGFSFRFYVEGIIQNPDIKMVSIDGVAPTVENIQSGAYPITGPLYAVTWEGNDNPNVPLLLDWILSEEGQWIIKETGYVPVGNGR